ncbi:hypothetical protein MRX96_017730 [Rhipicephalus microplus]
MTSSIVFFFFSGSYIGVALKRTKLAGGGTARACGSRLAVSLRRPETRRARRSPPLVSESARGRRSPLRSPSSQQARTPNPNRWTTYRVSRLLFFSEGSYRAFLSRHV